MEQVRTLTAVVATLAVLGSAGGAAAGDIRGTKHDLIANPDVGAQGTSDVCVFCHAVHGNEFGAPLWNRNAPATTSWTMYSSGTMDATVPGSPSGVSAACLSCHDGATAFDALTYKPANITFSGANKLSGIANTTANLGGNLANDHPISIRYGQPAADFNIVTQVTTAGVPLFGSSGNETVECGSCHDAHDVTNTPFLRISNASSALCLACHNK